MISMDRREAIKITALLMGGTVFAPNISGVLSGCTPRNDVPWKPKLFSAPQAALVTALADTIIPPDEDPGASDAGVPRFIDETVHATYTSAQQAYFLEQLDEFNRQARSRMNADFVDLDRDRQHRFTGEINQVAVKGELVAPDDALVKEPFILVFKELVLLGFFTSEAGATQVLQYRLNPGRFDGCMPLEEIGRAWA